MNDPSRLIERMRAMSLPSERGVVGLVDDLLGLGRDRGLRLEWRDDRFRLRANGLAREAWARISPPKPVFRAAMARLAVLCNERRPGSVSPYGGSGEVPIDTSPTLTLAVAFSNTPEESWLKLAPVDDPGWRSSPHEESWEEWTGSDVAPGPIENPSPR